MKKRQHVIRRSLEERRQFLHQQSSCRTNRMAEVFGGTTAEVTAVCCCFPCAVLDFSFLTMYKVPAGLYKNAVRRRRRLIDGRERRIDDELKMHPAVVAEAERFIVPEVDKDVLAFEDEMWKKFSESGFWRSRDD